MATFNDWISGLFSNTPQAGVNSPTTYGNSYQETGLGDLIIGGQTQSTIRYVATAAIIVGALYFLGGFKK